jgi:L-lactate dehydrogenase (cytochrome)
MNLSRCYRVADLRKLARRRLPSPVYQYLDGGSDDEVTLQRNTAAFDDYELLPSQLRDVSDVDTSATVLGQKLAMPLILSPTGMSRLFHHEAEPGAARAAEKHGVYYSLSTLATTSIESIGEEIASPKMFQIYIFRDRGLTAEFVDRCKASGFKAMCLTVDTPVTGNRERDLRTGFSMPPRFTAASLFSYAVHPHWALNLLRHRGFSMANVEHRVGGFRRKTVPLFEYVGEQFDPSINWKDFEWLAERWEGPLVIKGVQTASDARRAVDLGATAIMISNHGGRQLDGTPAPVDCIGEIADAVGDRAEIICDGGIRRGTHVLKALALGATACGIGRPYLYGLAAGGQRGVERVLELFQEEMCRDMRLLGCRTLGELRSSHVRRRAGLTSERSNLI